MNKQELLKLGESIRKNTANSDYIKGLAEFVRDETIPLYERFQLYLDSEDIANDCDVFSYQNPVLQKVIDQTPGIMYPRVMYPRSLSWYILSNRDRYNTYSAVEDLFFVIYSYHGFDDIGEMTDDSGNIDWKNVFNNLPENGIINTRHPNCQFKMTREELLQAIDVQTQSLVYEYKEDW